jgi:hypothetical protein
MDTRVVEVTAEKGFSARCLTPPTAPMIEAVADSEPSDPVLRHGPTSIGSGGGALRSSDPFHPDRRSAPAAVVTD